jgi:hypothetical protein
MTLGRDFQPKWSEIPPKPENFNCSIICSKKYTAPLPLHRSNLTGLPPLLDKKPRGTIFRIRFVLMHFWIDLMM